MTTCYKRDASYGGDSEAMQENQSSKMRNKEDRGYTGETLEENEEGEQVDEQIMNDYKPSPITGRISGSMEELERLQGSEANSTEVQECLKDSIDCYQTCSRAVITCLALGDEHTQPKHLNLLMDCARMCNTNADFILRNSTYYPQTCGLAADMCDECADSCDRFEDEPMKECASVCRRCSESCREMAR